MTKRIVKETTFEEKIHYLIYEQNYKWPKDKPNVFLSFPVKVLLQKQSYYF